KVELCKRGWRRGGGYALLRRTQLKLCPKRSVYREIGLLRSLVSGVEGGFQLGTVGPRSSGRPKLPRKFRYCKISGTARPILQGKFIRNSENQFATARFPVLRGPVLQGSTVPSRQ